jgi:hypothetical protein
MPAEIVAYDNNYIVRYDHQKRAVDRTVELLDKNGKVLLAAWLSQDRADGTVVADFLSVIKGSKNPVKRKKHKEALLRLFKSYLRGVINVKKRSDCKILMLDEVGPGAISVTADNNTDTIMVKEGSTLLEVKETKAERVTKDGVTFEVLENEKLTEKEISELKEMGQDIYWLREVMGVKEVKETKEVKKDVQTKDLSTPYYQTALMDSMLFVLARKEGRIVGLVRCNGTGGNGLINISDMMVHKDHRHRGIGTGLMHYFLSVVAAAMTPILITLKPANKEGSENVDKFFYEEFFNFKYRRVPGFVKWAHIETTRPGVIQRELVQYTAKDNASIEFPMEIEGVAKLIYSYSRLFYCVTLKEYQSLTGLEHQVSNNFGPVHKGG